MVRNEFTELLDSPRQYAQIEIPDSKAAIARGLHYFVGDKAKWLQGYDDVAAWLSNNNRKGLLLLGTNGRGKSLLCRDIIPTLIRYHYMRPDKVLILRAAELGSIKPNTPEYFNIKSANVIVVDDFGVEGVANVYGERRDMFSDIVDICEQNRIILICTTNLAPKEITARYGLRTLDRLKELTKVVCLEGESLRGKQTKKA